jgi:hypothetical protein
MPNLCECGCGKVTKYNDKKKRYNRFILGHNGRGKCRLFTEEHKENLSLSHIGQIPWHKGKHLSKRHKRNLSKNHADITAETRQKMNLAIKECSRLKKEEKEARLKTWENGSEKLCLCGCGEKTKYSERKKCFNDYIHYHHKPPHGRGKHSICNAGYGVLSSYERKFSDGLHACNIKHIYEPERFQLKGGLSYLPDYLILELNLYIELKGYMDTKSKIRHELFRRQGHKLLVLGERFFRSDELYKRVLQKVCLGNLKCIL